MTDKNKIVKFFVDSIPKVQSGYTCWKTLQTIDNKEFAIVMGTGDRGEGYELLMKLAYKLTNSLMSEYEWDWIMPYNEENGEVDDTETVIYNQNNIAGTIEWLFKIFEERYKKEEDKQHEI